ncbi:MAG: Lrp/AsnC family transcriptional regulator [Candidatus Aenigmarchaeota archaeon]|nr:Lrp/AsnC family transcriptional regulator [Candidatus Aenigmarchaeota archaeon]
MDRIDTKILAELDSHPRTPVAKLARKLRISQQVADYRIRRMIVEKRITKIGAIINLKALKQEHYRVFFTFNSSTYSSKEVFDYLGGQKGVYWSARTGGAYDLHVVLFVFDFAAFDNFMEKFNARFPGLVKNYTSCYGLNHYVYRHKFLSKDYHTMTYGYQDKHTDIDGLDHFILSKLKENCRLSSLEISREKQVSYKTIINRVKAMERANVILGYRMFMRTEDRKPFLVLFSFKDYAKERENKLIHYLERTESVTQAVRMFGVWNLLVHVRIEDNESLQQLIIDLRDKFDLIDNYEIIPIFEDVSIDLMPL